MDDYKLKTIQTYNELSGFYLDKFTNLGLFGKRIDITTFLGLLKGKKILDLGSGPGVQAEYFQNKGLEVVCCDLSPEMVKACRAKNLTATQMDIEDLQFEDNTFDGIWACGSLLHIPKKNMAFVASKMNQILKPGGLVYLSLKEGKGEKFITEKENIKYQRFFSYWTLDEFKKVVSPLFNVEIARVESSANGQKQFLAFYLRSQKKV